MPCSVHCSYTAAYAVYLQYTRVESESESEPGPSGTAHLCTEPALHFDGGNLLSPCFAKAMQSMLMHYNYVSLSSSTSIKFYDPISKLIRKPLPCIGVVLEKCFFFTPDLIFSHIEISYIGSVKSYCH